MDLLAFDFNLLRVFDAVYRHQSLSLAAVELGLTQPAVSAAVKRLRGHLANPLFVRTTGGMRPTPYAAEIEPKVQQVLQLVRNLDKPSAFEAATSDVHYRVYINDTGMVVSMPTVLIRLRELAPQARLTLVDLRPDEVVPALDSGDVDLAIGYFTGIPDWAHQQHLRTTRFVCLVRQQHPSIGETLSLEQFLACRHAVYATSGSNHYGVEQALARLNLTRQVTMTVPRLSALPFLVAQTDLIAIVPEDLGNLFCRLLPVKTLRLPITQATFQVKQYWHERLHSEPSHKWLRQTVRASVAAMLAGTQ